MRSPDETGHRATVTRAARRMARTTAAALASVGLTAATLVGAGAATAASTATPALIPAPHGWTAGQGSLRLGPRARINTDTASQGTARTLAGELRAAHGWTIPVVHGPARAGDIVLRTDPGRAPLGAEGYTLRIGDDVAITGRTGAGVFYGTRTVLQLLATATDLPRGATTDVPSYGERAVGVCACYTYDTDAWFGRLIKDMAYLKLNTLHLELKVRDERYPAVNTFSYYTKPEVARLVALAARYHIAVIPEINSPGHVDPYLTPYPDLQLTDAAGTPDPTRLDITDPAAFTFYTRLIDNDLSVFPGRYFHMGADEYMINSAYSNYPQLLAYAQAKFGPKATPQDAYIDFINRVDAYVHTKGRTLRIWNDGLTGENTVPLNKDVVVEHWLPETVTSQQLLDAGHRVMNATDAWYYVRGGYQPDAKKLYESGWTPLDFADGTVTGGPALTGAEYMVWPDDYGKETENQVQQGMSTSLRAFAQSVWGGPRPADDWAGFTALADSLGHAPGWGPRWTQPLPAGDYRLSATAGSGLLSVPPGTTAAGTALVADPAADPATASWQLRPTDDGYYQLALGDSGLCAEISRGPANNMHVVEQEGATATAETCGAAETQKWQLEPVAGGYRIVDAITQEALDASGADGTVVQQPRDTARADVWAVTPAV